MLTLVNMGQIRSKPVRDVRLSSLYAIVGQYWPIHLCYWGDPATILQISHINSMEHSGFLRNSRKYGLGSLKKTPTEGNPPIGLGPK